MQSSFLAETAKCLFDRYGRDISSLAIVLPSVRARLFFTDELSRLADRPLWSPQYMSMDDIMREASSFSVGEKVRLVTELYKVYSEYHDEPFDKFYFWGEMLLGDFDLLCLGINIDISSTNKYTTDECKSNSQSDHNLLHYTHPF